MRFFLGIIIKIGKFNLIVATSFTTAGTEQKMKTLPIKQPPHQIDQGGLT